MEDQIDVSLHHRLEGVVRHQFGAQQPRGPTSRDTGTAVLEGREAASEGAGAHSLWRLMVDKNKNEK
jgi:hypothetical protein